MSPQEIRLEILKLLRLPDLASPDVAKVIDRAKALEAYVSGAGQAQMPPRETVTLPPQTQARTLPQLSAPARK
jgi:hypothetical protein